MGLFSRKQKGPDRGELLAKNEGIPFSIEIIDDRSGETLAYTYTNVACSITGDVSGMSPGAILYVRKDGVLANVAHENIGRIENEKLISMVNDFFDEDRFTTVRAKYVGVEGDKILCNLGFWTDDEPEPDNDEEDEDLF